MLRFSLTDVLIRRRISAISSEYDVLCFIALWTHRLKEFFLNS